MGGKEGGKGNPIQSEEEEGGVRRGEGRNPGGPFFSHPSIEPIPMVHPNARPMGQRIHTPGREGGVNPTPTKERSHEPPRTMPKEKGIVPGRRKEGNRRNSTSDGSGDGWERRNERARRRPRRTRPSGHAMEGTEAFQGGSYKAHLCDPVPTPKKGNDPKTNECPRVILHEPIAGPKERKPRSYQRPEQDTGQERTTESDASPLFKAPVESPCSLHRVVATRAPTRSDATKAKGNVHKDAPAMLRRAS